MNASKEEILKYFADYIHKELGIVYEPENYYQLETRLNQLCKLCGKTDISALYADAKKGIDEKCKQLLLDISTNNETSFFRDPKVFAGFKAAAELISGESSRYSPLRIWSAASSTGQEPYSIAMILKEMINRIPSGTFSILATDISEKVIQLAKEGVYSPLEVSRGLSEELRKKYFEMQTNDKGEITGWKIKNELKMYVEYKKLNLLSPFPDTGKFDFILCRNVLIYQTHESKKRIVEKFTSHLADGGYLILGGAESLMGISDQFEMARVSEAVFYKKIVSRQQVG